MLASMRQPFQLLQHFLTLAISLFSFLYEDHSLLLCSQLYIKIRGWAPSLLTPGLNATLIQIRQQIKLRANLSESEGIVILPTVRGKWSSYSLSCLLNRGSSSQELEQNCTYKKCACLQRDAFCKFNIAGYQFRSHKLVFPLPKPGRLLRTSRQHFPRSASSLNGGQRYTSASVPFRPLT